MCASDLNIELVCGFRRQERDEGDLDMELAWLASIPEDMWKTFSSKEGVYRLPTGFKIMMPASHSGKREELLMEDKVPCCGKGESERDVGSFVGETPGGQELRCPFLVEPKTIVQMEVQPQLPKKITKNDNFCSMLGVGVCLVFGCWVPGPR